MTPSVEPRLMYEPVQLAADEEDIVHQAGAFPVEAEPQKVLEIWRSEGVQAPLAINVVPVYETAEHWQAEL
ncbi:hypothetical protein AB0J74_28165 [Asanoa sp. NPDC049573]|uniref:hypothetical protein n=1 Tax=Asanoa sp. NPDC049573 TaxID=3155396 RepID=UPI00343F3D0C